jgi:hypothetical protein
MPCSALARYRLGLLDGDGMPPIRCAAVRERGLKKQPSVATALNKLDLCENTERAFVSYALDFAPRTRKLGLLHRVRLGTSR